MKTWCDSPNADIDLLCDLCYPTLYINVLFITYCQISGRPVVAWGDGWNRVWCRTGNVLLYDGIVPV